MQSLVLRVDAWQRLCYDKEQHMLFPGKLERACLHQASRIHS